MSKKLISLMCLCAGVLSSVIAHAQIRPVLTLGLGSDTTILNTNESIVIFAPFQNNYVGGGNDTETIGSFFLGAEIPFLKSFAWQLGAAYYQSVNPLMPTGSVIQFGNPFFNNLNYYFNIYNRRYLLQTKFLYTLKQYVHPYILAAAGEAVNKSSDYTETGVTSADVGMGEPFADKTVRSFTYTAGLGLDIDVNAHTRFGLSYSYANLGHAALGVSSLQDSTTTLKINHLDTTEWMMQLTFID